MMCEISSGGSRGRLMGVGHMFVAEEEERGNADGGHVGAGPEPGGWTRRHPDVRTSLSQLQQLLLTLFARSKGKPPPPQHLACCGSTRIRREPSRCQLANRTALGLDLAQLARWQRAESDAVVDSGHTGFLAKLRASRSHCL